MGKTNACLGCIPLIVLLMLLVQEKSYGQLKWPVEPVDKDHPIVNCFGEFQHFSGDPYLHTGIDIQARSDHPDPWVISVMNGKLKWTEIEGDPSVPMSTVNITNGTTTFTYSHLYKDSILTEVKDADSYGNDFPVDAKIGKIADWYYTDYDHLHFSIRRNGEFINPLTDAVTGGILPDVDTKSPQVKEILVRYADTGSIEGKPVTGCWIVKGKLDIIAAVGDTNPPDPAIAFYSHTGIYRIEYSIQKLTGTGTQNVVPPKMLYQFDAFSESDSGLAELKIVYSYEAPEAQSVSKYSIFNGERYYYIVSNVDSNGNLSDANGYWDTGIDADGLYQIDVTAYDYVGNANTLSEIVFVKNDATTSSPIELYIRDSEHDNGALPSNPNGEPFWKSPDIRVDAPPFDEVNATGLPFGADDHDNPIYGQANRVHIRVHNQGCSASGTVGVHLYWADPSGGIPQSAWNAITPTAQLSNIPSQDALEIDPPILWTPTGTAIGNRCLLVRLESAEDPIVNDYDVVWENNVALKNVTIVQPAPGEPAPSYFFINNPQEEPGKGLLIIDRKRYPRKAGLFLELPSNEALLKVLKKIKGITMNNNEEEGVLEIGIWQECTELPVGVILPGTPIQAKVLFVFPEKIKVKQAFTVDITQTINGTVTGGMTFEIPRKSKD